MLRGLSHNKFSREMGPEADQSKSPSRLVGDDGDSPHSGYCSAFLISWSEIARAGRASV